MRELLLRDDLPLPTSTGSGVGKTRPALQVAADLSQVGRRP